MIDRIKKEGKIRTVILIIAFIAITIIACFRYFSVLDAHPCFEDDEFQTEEVAKWYSDEINSVFQVDLIKELRHNLDYNRAWPYTIVLGNWIHYFGFSEASCRQPSALFGVLTIASLFYISYRLYKSIFVSLLSSLLLLSEPVVTGYFRLTRMYSMAILFALWLYYFIFRMLVKHNPFSRRIPLFDFQFIYLLPIVVLLYYSYQIHVNTLIMLLGVVLFVFLYAFIGKEKRYKYFIVLFFALVLIGILFCQVVMAGSPYAPRFFEILADHAAFFKNIYIGYFRYFLEIVSNKWIGLFLLMVIIFLDCKDIKNHNIQAIDVYLISVCGATVLFFVCMTDRYFVEYYMCMLMPFAALFYASGIKRIFQYCKDKCENNAVVIATVVLVVLMMVFSIHRFIIGYAYLYTDQEAMNYPMAYDTVSQYFDKEEEVPLVKLFSREPYISEAIPNKKDCDLNRENDMDILYDFAMTDSPEGIITCEDIKFGALTQGMMGFVTMWSDHISGDGVDASNVEVSHYNFLLPDYSLNDGITMDDSIIETSVNDEGILLYLNREALAADCGMEDVEFVSVGLDFALDDGSIKKRFFQFVLDDDYVSIPTDGIFIYHIPQNRIKGIDMDMIRGIEVGDEYAFYAEGALRDRNRTIIP